MHINTQNPSRIYPNYLESRRIAYSSHKTLKMDQKDTPMSNAPPTPGEDMSPAAQEADARDTEPQNPTVDFSPATVPYNEAFENSLMNLILHPPDNITPPNPSHDSPVIPANQLPIPLDSPLRTHPSPIPGLFVTNANGYYTGGPAPSPMTVKQFAHDFIQEHGVEDAGQLERVVEQVMKEKMEEVQERMQEREKAVQKNKLMDEELEKLRLQRDAELRVLEKMKGVKR